MKPFSSVSAIYLHCLFELCTYACIYLLLFLLVTVYFYFSSYFSLDGNSVIALCVYIYVLSYLTNKL